jgi:hypothetical protein
MSSGASNLGDNVAEPGSSPLNYPYCQAIPPLPPFAFKAITKLYLYPFNARYYLVMYRTKCNTKISGNSFRKSTVTFCSVYTALRQEKSHYKILGTVVFWVTK